MLYYSLIKIYLNIMWIYLSVNCLMKHLKECFYLVYS